MRDVLTMAIAVREDNKPATRDKDLTRVGELEIDKSGEGSPVTNVKLFEGVI
mgnify:CR=1 FL=1